MPRWFLWFLAAYTGVLAFVASRLSLWLDELIDLIQIRAAHDVGALLAVVPLNAGGVPLSYLVRSVVSHALGYSPFVARLPSLAASILAIVGMAYLGKEAGLRRPFWAAALFALLPIQARYAAESRPYAMELCLLVWATLVFLRASEARRIGWWLLYGTLCTAILYTQPYGVFVCLAHAADAAMAKRGAWLPAVLALAGASLLFAPWAIPVAALWQHSPDRQPTYFFDLRSGAGIVKDVFGAGFAGTMLLSALAFGGGQVRYRRLWLLMAAFGAVLPIAANSWFHYFAAPRQWIALAIPGALLAVVGYERWDAAGNGRLAKALLSVLVAVFLYANCRFLVRPREDWARASFRLQRLVSRGACVQFVPADSVRFYAFFSPGLGGATCTNRANDQTIVVAKSPYRADQDYQRASRELTAAGYQAQESTSYGGPQLIVFQAR